ncbi:MAG: serine hydrolase [Bacteroidales bacterium]|nr:serine hydrolase [Tenuifilaceae bacterium]
MKFCKAIVVVLFIFLSLGSSWEAKSQRAPELLFNADSMEQLSNDIRNDKYGKLSSLLIYQNQRIVFESYYGFTQLNTLHPISSVTKSITSLAVGICIDKGFIPSLDVKIADFFPEYNDIFQSDSLKSLITLRHLLTQTSGFKWDEWSIHYSYAGNPLIELSHLPKYWIPIILKLPMESTPGKVFNYNSACSELIKEIVMRSSGIDFKAFVYQYLFEPLGITTFYWDSYFQNNEPAWGGLFLTTRDMAKIGILVNNQGFWGSKSVVSEEWINNSVSEVVKIDSIGYGKHWWIKKQPDGNPLIYAAGYGDQYVFIARDKGLVVAINAKNFTDYKWESDFNDLIERVLRAYTHKETVDIAQQKVP